MRLFGCLNVLFEYRGNGPLGELSWSVEDLDGELVRLMLGIGDKAVGNREAANHLSDAQMQFVG